jgi:hypothetical protein
MMPDLDPAELARSLEKISANLARLIKEEGLKVGAALGKSHAKAAREQIQAKDVELQRANARIHDLEKLLGSAEAGREARLEAERRLMNVRMCKVWIDDLGRKFVFCDELWHATNPEHNPKPQPARLNAEASDAPRS